MPKYNYNTKEGKTLTLEADIQPSDSDVESAAKSNGLTLIHASSNNDNASQTDNVVKPSNDSALKASQTPLAPPSEGSKPRGDTESIGATKSLSKGNLEANGGKAQDNIINSDEHDSLLSKGWKLLSDPLTNLPSKAAKSISDTINPNSETKGIRGIGSAFIEGLGHVGDEMTSPLNAGLMALTGGESLASKMGAEDIIPALRTGSKILSAPIIAHGASNVIGDDKSLDDRAMGLVEMGMGSMPFFHGSEPAVATDLLKFSSKELPDVNDALDNRPDLVPVNNNAEKAFNDTRTNIPVNEEDRLLDLVKNKQNMGKELPIDDLTNDNDKLTPPTNFKVPQFNPRNQSGLTGNLQNKPRLLLNSDGSFINKETGEMYDMRGHQINELDQSRPPSLIDASDQMNNKELNSSNGGDNEPPSYDPLDPHADEPNPKNNPNEDKSDKKISLSDIINFPKSMKTIWHVGAAPFRQGAGLITTKPWWTAWNDMFEGMKGMESYNATQKAISNRPLFKSYNGEDSFAQKVGLKLTDLGSLSNREEDNMSKLADKIPGVKMTQRGYTAYLNKLRADSFENLLSKFKVLGEDGEYNIPLAKELANYVNNATGRGSLRTNPTLEGITGNLEKSAVALNNAFFSPRFIASRLSILGNSGKAVFTPSTYMFSQPSVRREYLRSLLSIAGIGATLGELAKQSGMATVEHDPTSSDFGKIKVGNTRVDTYAGLQQPIVLASRLLTGNETSSSSGKTTDLANPKFGQDTRMDVLGKFARSKESPALSFAHSMAVGRRPDGTKFDLPEDVANMFVPLILQDLKEVATDNPNLIPNYHTEGLGFENTNANKSLLAIPGAMGMGIQNYHSKRDN